jgi:hypothetical protein
MAKLLSQAQFARKMKKSRSWVCGLIKQGVVGLVSGGKIDSEEAKKRIEAFVDSKANRKSKLKPRPRNKRSPQSTLSNGERTLIEVRRDNEILKGELLAIKLRIEQGDLVAKGESIQWLSSMVAVAKSAFWNMPRRMGEILSSIADPKEVELQLRKEIRIILEQLAEPLTEKQWTEALEKEGEDPEFEERLRLKREKAAAEEVHKKSSTSRRG